MQRGDLFRARARTTATDGILFLSYTPLKGGGELTYRFLNEYSPDRIDIRIDAQEARHISAGAPRAARGSYLPHEREARIHGIPQLGIARVFPFPLESLMRQLRSRQGHSGWAKWLVGIDFGYATPSLRRFARGYRRSTNFYVVDGFKMESGEALYHVKRVAAMCRGLRIPIAWPHDGLTHEKGSGVELAEVYRAPGCADAAVTRGEQRRRLPHRTGHRGHVQRT